MKENLLRGDFFFPEDEKNENYKASSSTYLKTTDLTTKAQVHIDPNDPTSAKVNASADSWEAYGKIHCDIFNINKYMLNNIDIKLVFTRSSDSFCLLGAAGSKCVVSIADIFLRIRRVRVSNYVMLAHAMALEQTTAKYPMPTRVVVGFVKTSAYGGTREQDPFYFHHIVVIF